MYMRDYSSQKSIEKWKICLLHKISPRVGFFFYLCNNIILTFSIKGSRGKKKCPGTQPANCQLLLRTDRIICRGNFAPKTFIWMRPITPRTCTFPYWNFQMTLQTRRSVGHNFLKWREVTISCCYRSTCLLVISWCMNVYYVFLPLFLLLHLPKTEDVGRPTLLYSTLNWVTEKSWLGEEKKIVKVLLDVLCKLFDIGWNLVYTWIHVNCK